MAATPILILTGFLGAGKTTILSHFVAQLTSTRVAWMKNEFGDAGTDSLLMQSLNQSNQGKEPKESILLVTKEIVNGCLCCTLTGRLGDGLMELIQDYHPDLVVIETSGSAFPGPIVWEIRRLVKEGKLHVIVDAVVCVVDVLNFKGYEDTSYTAKLQVKETDLILINKHELVSAEEFEKAMDSVFELNPDTPKIKTDNGFVSKDLLLGFHAHIESEKLKFSEDFVSDHHSREVLVASVETCTRLEFTTFDSFLKSLSKEEIYRVKGVVLLEEGCFLVNWAFGRSQLTHFADPLFSKTTKLNFIGVSISLALLSVTFSDSQVKFI